MIDTVDLLLEYYEKGTSSNLFSHLQGFSSRDIRVVVIEILGWLKLEHKRELWIREGKKTRLKPLMLNYNYPWCQNLQEMMNKEVLLNQYFCIEDNKFDFSSNITEEKRKKARKKAFDYYDPPKRS